MKLREHTANGDPRHEPLGHVEDGGKSHRRDSRCKGILPKFVMRGHAQFMHKTVDTETLDGQGYAKRHGKDHEQCVGSPDESHLNMVVEHVAHKVDKRHTRHDEEGTGHHRMPRSGGDQERLKDFGNESHRRRCGDLGCEPCD